MKNNKVSYIIIGLLLGVLIGIFASSYSVNNNMTGMMRMMGMRPQQQGAIASSDVLDAHFIEQMIPHHEDAITMANSALTKAKKNEVKDLAKNIIAAQKKEIDQMKVWYKNWYGRELPTGDEVMSQHGMMGNSGMHMGMMGNESDMSRLEDAEDFDKAFIEGMIPHHQMAVMMASMLKDGTNRPEMKKLADDIITTQTDEIDQMRSWYNEW